MTTGDVIRGHGEPVTGAETARRCIREQARDDRRDSIEFAVYDLERAVRREAVAVFLDSEAARAALADVMWNEAPRVLRELHPEVRERTERSAGKYLAALREAAGRPTTDGRDTVMRAVARDAIRREAEASVALDHDPEQGTHSVDDGCPGGHRGER